MTEQELNQLREEAALASREADDAAHALFEHMEKAVKLHRRWVQARARRRQLFQRVMLATSRPNAVPLVTESDVSQN